MQYYLINSDNGGTTKKLEDNIQEGFLYFFFYFILVSNMEGDPESILTPYYNRKEGWNLCKPSWLHKKMNNLPISCCFIVQLTIFQLCYHYDHQEQSHQNHAQEKYMSIETTSKHSSSDMERKKIDNFLQIFILNRIFSLSLSFFFLSWVYKRVLEENYRAKKIVL